MVLQTKQDKKTEAPTLLAQPWHPSIVESESEPLACQPASQVTGDCRSEYFKERGGKREEERMRGRKTHSLPFECAPVCIAVELISKSLA